MNLINDNENQTFSKVKALQHFAKRIIEQDEFEINQDVSVNIILDLDQQIFRYRLFIENTCIDVRVYFLDEIFLIFLQCIQSSVIVGLSSDTFFQPDPTRRTKPKTQP
jgi:hypothetical protein